MDLELLLGPRLAGAAVRVRDDLAPRDRRAQRRLQPVDPRAVLVDDRRAHAAGAGRGAHQRLGLLLRCRHRRHRPSTVGGVEVRPVGREPDRAGTDRLGDDRLHLLDLVVGGFALVALGAHRPEPHRSVPDVRAEVDPDAARADPLPVRRVVLPCPVDADRQRLRRHVLDEVQRAHHRVARRLTARRERQAAVPGDDAGDPLQARRREPRVPEDLRVVVRVEIDEPRGDQRSVGVEHPVAA